MSVNFNTAKTSELYNDLHFKTNNNEKRYQFLTNPTLKTLQTDTVELSTKTDKYVADDGKISTEEKLTNFVKGIISPITAMFKSPKALLTGAISVAGMGALTITTGGAIAPALITLGLAGGAIQLGSAVCKATAATTDDEARSAWQGIGAGTSALVGSVIGAKTAAKGAKIANAENMNPIEATIACIKNTPNSINKSLKSFTSGEFLVNLRLKKASSNEGKISEDKSTQENQQQQNTRIKEQQAENKSASNTEADKVEIEQTKSNNMVDETPKIESQEAKTTPDSSANEVQTTDTIPEEIQTPEQNTKIEEQPKSLEETTPIEKTSISDKKEVVEDIALKDKGIIPEEQVKTQSTTTERHKDSIAVADDISVTNNTKTKVVEKQVDGKWYTDTITYDVDSPDVQSQWLDDGCGRLWDDYHFKLREMQFNNGELSEASKQGIIKNMQADFNLELQDLIEEGKSKEWAVEHLMKKEDILILSEFIWKI